MPNATTVTVYDDHCCQLTGGGTYVNPTGPSRGLVLRIDQRARSVTLVGQYLKEKDFDAAYMGDTQQLSNGNVFVGWGSEPYFSEFSPSGRLLFEAELPGPNLTYRATLEQWQGEPLTVPLGAVRRSAGKTTVYASWNGATALASWRVLAGGRAVATHARSGFETGIAVPGAAASTTSFTVQALDASGRVIGSSKTFS
jgi:Arylsulfotransferase (ASST)